MTRSQARNGGQEPEPASSTQNGGHGHHTLSTSKAPLTISRPELLVNDSDLKFRELVNNLLAFAARHEAIRNGHAAYIGLPGAQYTTLITIRHLESEQPVTVRLVAEHLHVTPTFVTMETKKLRQAGLITKTRSQRDSRAVNLVVTEAGHDLLATLSPVQQQINDQQFAELSTEEFDELHRLVQRLIKTSDRAIALQNYLTVADLGE